MTELEARFESLGLEKSGEHMIAFHTEKSVRNPLPSQMKIGDYYVNISGWQRRYITSIEGDSCEYACYALEGYSLGGSCKLVNGKYERIPPNSGYFIRIEGGYCTKAHIRNWSQKK